MIKNSEKQLKAFSCTKHLIDWKQTSSYRRWSGSRHFPWIFEIKVPSFGLDWSSAVSCNHVINEK